MKKNVTLIAIFIFLIYPLFAQNSSIELLFTGDNNGDHVPLDSIYIKNLTQGGDIMLYAPDTLLNLMLVGLNESHTNLNSSLNLSQNFPNPFKEKTEFNLYLSKTGLLEIEVFNLLGKRILEYQRLMKKGTHHFSFIPGGEKVYLLSATACGITKSIKMFCASDSKSNCKINHEGKIISTHGFKSAGSNKDFPFELGDILLFVGYIELGESGMQDSPGESSTYTIQFATNIPCIGTPTVDYEGQIYNTIQIYSQCWFKENLNVGEMIPVSQSQTNNNTIEKCCMGDDAYYCNNFAGGLYFWDEMMNYTNEPGGQGICPEGWHIPDDMDWQILEGAVDSEYKIGNPEWGYNDWRGSDAGGNLKQTGTTNWVPPNTGATDAFGFSALPGGYIVQGGFWGLEYKGYFWSSDIVENFFRNMDWNQVKIKRDNGVGSGLAISVRCVKD